jgi:hypothetical protein
MAHPIRITGNALADEYGVTVIVRDVALLRFDVAVESQQLLEAGGVRE